ncbi:MULTISPECIES: hypothetical protein [Yersinia]|uniref:hypothetical protein n=1 Tax=Yersinia TaxID=629 RepID=UPI00119FF8A2|nr:hypothetical protein [Yersinia kristensenii]MBW5812547.1 hypothetical protein [Yersinia kristensenii]MBW5817925.1 hypothetical protein [Yersinia kristensenii]MBW5829848.1 hypothetical protein [Yersinia kristensenii]MBW5842241.1 hypothetical protein [Yersinia kristensenii]MDA5490297.1 hypothetical protein [Yersinia kristensenii]
MPVSAMHHRSSCGSYQNISHKKNSGGNALSAQGIKPSHSATLDEDEIDHFGKSISRIANYPEEPHRRSNQNTAPLWGIAIPVLTLLSQVKLSSNLISTTSDNSAIVPGNSFSAMLSPVTNALHELDQFISQNDPLKFSTAAAAPLCASSHPPDDFVSYLNANGINVVARGLEQLKCIEHDKYEFFKGVAYNSMKLLDSAIQQLEDKTNNELDNHLRYYGIVDVNDVKPRLISLYKSIKSEIDETLKSKRDSVYYGYGSMDETAKVDAMVQINDRERRILLTDNFFGKCTINSVNILIHEMSHFHTKLDLFQIIKEKSCLKNGNGSEITIHAQLDDSIDFYSYSTCQLKEENIETDQYIQLFYNMDRKEFVDKFNTNKTVKEEAIFINADSISNLAIAIGNYGFKRNNIMPLLDTSEFKTGKPIES